MRALGFTCGIGSMLLGAQRAGFDVIGNIEWRKYYNTGTFQRNFPGAFYSTGIDDMRRSEIDACKGVDLIVGHTECGAYSNLSNTSRAMNGDDYMKALRVNKGDMPGFIAAINLFQPKYFFMDNLPGSLKAIPIEEWRDALPDYNIETHLISNYHYGNIQRYRIRLFYIGWRKDLPFKFICGEFDHRTTTEYTIGDLGDNPIPEINHVPIKDNEYLSDGQIFTHHGDNLPIGSVKQVFARLGHGKTWEYHNSKGEHKLKAGYVMTYRDKFCHTLTGRNSIFHYTGRPLTIRERARIQGLPDDFIFVGAKENKVEYIKQTGKCMPIQFCHYLAGLIRGYIDPCWIHPVKWPETFMNVAIENYYKINPEGVRFIGFPQSGDASEYMHLTEED